MLKEEFQVFHHALGKVETPGTQFIMQQELTATACPLLL